MRPPLPLLVALCLGHAAVGCESARGALPEAVVDPATEEPVEVEREGAAFDELLRVEAPVTDGFSSPVGVGWRALDPAEVACPAFDPDCPRDGPGCDAAGSCWARSQPGVVSAPAAAVVTANTGALLALRTQYYENHNRKLLTMVLRGVDSALAPGATVARGQRLGTSQQLHVQLIGEPAPSFTEFVAARPSLPVPQAEPVLVLIHHDSHTMRVYQDGAPSGTYAVSFGQQAGVKERRGDNRTPKGVYYVVAKSTGPFDGPYGAYYGGHWIKINYPNAYDAARGVDQGLITPAQQVAISRAWRARQLTLTDTSLGGGIGLHGWAKEWEDNGPRHLSWGCVVLHLKDVAAIYAAIPERAMVILF